METRALTKQYGPTRAVDAVSLGIRKAEIFGLVGESGCGKSTVARMLVGLVPPTSGTILLDGAPPGPTLPRRAQMVFQDPYSSLNPAFTVRAILWEGLGKTSRLRGPARETALAELVERVGLSRAYLNATPHQLSGGQRQRVGIARALTLAPDILVADEPTSALDVSVQAQVLNLFADLQQRLGLTMLFVSHDFGVVRYLCDRVAVMYLGRIVEQGPAEDVLRHPRHPYTAALVASMPRPERRHARARPLPGELPDPAERRPGCRFHPRCAHGRPDCLAAEPALDDAPHAVACFHPLS